MKQRHSKVDNRCNNFQLKYNEDFKRIAYSSLKNLQNEAKTVFKDLKLIIGAMTSTHNAINTVWHSREKASNKQLEVCGAKMHFQTLNNKSQSIFWLQ